MKNNQKGFVGIALIIALALAAIGGGVYYSKNQNNEKKPASVVKLEEDIKSNQDSSSDPLEIKVQREEDTRDEILNNKIQTKVEVKSNFSDSNLNLNTEATTSAKVESKSPTPTNLKNPPSISYLNFSSGVIGQPVEVVGSNFESKNYIHFGIGKFPAYLSSGGDKIVFQVPQTIDGCVSSEYNYAGDPNGRCTSFSSELVKIGGTYEVRVSNANGTSTAVNFKVTGSALVSSNANAPKIDSVDYNPAVSGQNIIIKGQGFTPSNNTVFLDTENVFMGLTSQYGNEIQLNATGLKSGTYNLSVYNSNGTTNSQAVTVSK